MTEERWYRLTYWPLVAASVVFIVVYSVQVIGDLHGSSFLLGRIVIAITWGMFAVDYIVRLCLARARGRWFLTHLFDLAIVVLPALKPLRLLRALTLVSVLQRTVGTALRSRIAIYGAGASLILIWIISLAVLDAEQHAPGANIRTFGDAVWWAFVTLSTVGYGDYYPVTGWGRAMAVLLMSGGVAVVGVVTATLASWVIERASAGHDDDEPATRKQVRELSREIRALRAEKRDAAAAAKPTE